MAKTTWAGKMPADMTDEELREAKQALVDLVEPAQERLNMLSAAVGQLNREVNDRFRMQTGVPASNTLPEYPLEAIVGEFGTTQ